MVGVLTEFKLRLPCILGRIWKMQGELHPSTSRSGYSVRYNKNQKEKGWCNK